MKWSKLLTQATLQCIKNAKQSCCVHEDETGTGKFVVQLWTWVAFCWVPFHCGLRWNEISDELAEEGAVKNLCEILYSNLLLSSHEISSVLEKSLDPPKNNNNDNNKATTTITTKTTTKNPNKQNPKNDNLRYFLVQGTKQE